MVPALVYPTDAATFRAASPSDARSSGETAGDGLSSSTF